MKTFIQDSSSLKTKVIFIVPNLQFGGSETVVLKLVKYLKAKNDVEIICVNDGDGFFQSKSPVNVNSIYSVSKIKKISYFKIVYKIAKIVKKYNKTSRVVLLGFGEVPIIACSIIKLLQMKNTKVISCVRNVESRHFSQNGLNLKSRIKMYVFSYLIKKSDLITVNADISKKDLIENFNIRNKIQVIYNPISGKIQEKTIKNEKSKPIRILNVGRLEKQKGQSDLVSLSALLEKKSIEHVIDIYGSGSLENQLKFQAKGSNAKVCIHDFTKDISSVYKNSDLFILTSYWEGMPNVLLEAMSYGLPVISYDCPSGPREITLNGKYGTIVQTGDLEALCLSVQLVVESYCKYSKLSLERAEDFDIANIGPSWQEVIQSV